MKKFILLSAAILLCFVSNAQTNVSGGIYANTTWTLANSPYIVVDTLVVFPGVTLTIQPGVVVKFNNNMYLEIRDANINATGTIVDSITFTSNAVSPTHGSWKNILFTNNLVPNNRIFHYCNFKYATNGIKDNGGGSIDTTIIKNSTFRSNDYGINGLYAAKVVLDDDNFLNNFTAGIDFGSGHFRTLNNCIFLNNAAGISYGQDETFLNCTFRLNTTAITSISYSKILSCIISNNQNGINNYTNQNNLIKNCQVDSNTVYGVYLGNNDSLINCEIKYNGIGVKTSTIASINTVSMCSIENNGIGINLTGTNSNIYCNKICNNTSYGLKYIGVPNRSLANNYWCTSDSASTSALVFDGYDNVLYGLINFMPLDTSSCYLTGCNLHITATVTNASCATCPTGTATANVINGMPPYIYTWYTSPIQTTHTATGLTSGMYQICVTDANGCSTCDSVFIDSTVCNGFSAQTTSVNATCGTCNDGSATALHTGGTAPFSYTWYTSPMQSYSIASGLTPGNYSVCITDAHSCVACDTVTVSVGNCSAHFNLYPDVTPHTYVAVNMASGTGPLTYSWDWGDGNTSPGPFPSHTYAAAGFYTICLTITDSIGCTNTYCSSFFLTLLPQVSMIIVNVIPPTAVGINELSAEEYISIAPNPFTSQTTITFSKEQKNTTIKIRDVIGQIVNSRQATGNSATLDMSDYANGIYFVEINSDSRIYRKKIVKN